MSNAADNIVKTDACHRCGATIYLIKVSAATQTYKWVTDPSKLNTPTWHCGHDPEFPLRSHAPQQVAAPPIHKATPAAPFATDAESVCVHCHREIKRVPGGHGPVWVHADTGTVVGSGGVTVDA